MHFLADSMDGDGVAQTGVGYCDTLSFAGPVCQHHADTVVRGAPDGMED